jgi:type I restriction enzyme, S subunit
VSSSIELQDVAEIRSGGTPPRGVQAYYGGKIPWAKISDLDAANGVVSSTEESITDAGLDAIRGRLFPTGTLLFAIYGSIGKMAFAGAPLSTNQAILGIEIKDVNRLDNRFLFRLLQARSSKFENDGQGIAQKNLSAAYLRRLKLLVPPLDEQRRIAAILDQADYLRRKRREALEQVNSFRSALFRSMFGDPVRNEMHWVRQSFDSVIDGIASGWSPVCLDRPASDSEWGVLKLSAVTNCEYDETEQKALRPDVPPKPGIEVKVGDILLTRKNTRDLVAACALVTHTRPRLMFSDLIYRIRLKPDAPADSTFVHSLLTRPAKRREIQSLASGSAGSMPNISKEKLRAVEIELPPLDL